MLDARNNELLAENDLEPLKELTELADLSLKGNSVCAKVEYISATNSSVPAWAREHIPLIESVDNVEINEAGHRFNLRLQEAVEVIDVRQLENEEAKNIFKELNEKAVKYKEAEELQLSTSLTPSKTTDSILADTESNLAELRTLTERTLLEMDEIYSKEAISYEKVSQLRPDIFLTAQTPAASSVPAEDLSASQETERSGKEEEFKEAGKSGRVGSALSSAERKQPRTVIKAVNKPKKDLIPKPIGMKQTLRYQKETRRGILSMMRSNGFLQKDKAAAFKPGSKAKMKYEVARKIDSSLNP